QEAFPLVVKPRWGTASTSVYEVHEVDELIFAAALARRQIQRGPLASASASDPDHSVLIQEKLEGTEHGLDVVNDLDGRYMATFARRKRRMRAGETDSAVTVADPRLDALGACLGLRLGHVGNLDCDVFVDDERYSVLEMNARFGGG